jgi:drug/metabolite transporter (DMT)-like permease
MWFVFALLSAVFYALLWVFARMSRGIPSTVVTAGQFVLGPFLFLSTLQTIDYPWGEWWWHWYLVFPLCLTPLVLWAMTYAVHRTAVTLLAPLFGLSSLTTLLVAVTFFGAEVTPWGVFGIFLVTIGLLCLYHGQWEAWAHRGPWIVLAGGMFLGVNAAVAAEVVERFPYFLALSALFMTGGFAINAIPALPALSSTPWSWRTISILLGMVVATTGQDLTTLAAFSFGPSPYVIAVKRTSILLVALLGYVFLHERGQSLQRLLLSSGLVVLGVILLTVR